MKEEQLRELFDAGLRAFGCYFEIWDREKFKKVCPGKEKYIGYDEFLERTLKTVEIFGEGNVLAGFVPGCEMAPPPYGFGADNLDEAVSSTLEGFKFLLENGIIPLGTNLLIEPGTTFYKIGMTFRDLPLEFFAKLDLGRFYLYKKYKAYPFPMCAKHQPYGGYGDMIRLL
jgi:hypothetical protein